MHGNEHSFPDARGIARSTGDGFIYTLDRLSDAGRIGFREPGGPDAVDKHRVWKAAVAAVGVEPVAVDDVDNSLGLRLWR